MFALYWTREDRQGDICMGEDYPTEQAAWDAKPEMEFELLSQGSDFDHFDQIKRGSWSVQRVED